MHLRIVYLPCLCVLLQSHMLAGDRWPPHAATHAELGHVSDTVLTRVFMRIWMRFSEVSELTKEQVYCRLLSK